MTGADTSSGTIEVSRLSVGIEFALCALAAALVAAAGSGLKAVLGLVLLGILIVVTGGWLLRRTPLVSYDRYGITLWGRYFATRAPVVIEWAQVDDLGRQSVRTLRYLVISYTQRPEGRDATRRRGADEADAEVAEAMAALVADDGERRRRIPYWLCRGHTGAHLAAMQELWETGPGLR